MPSGGRRDACAGAAHGEPDPAAEGRGMRRWSFIYRIAGRALAFYIAWAVCIEISNEYCRPPLGTFYDFGTLTHGVICTVLWKYSTGIDWDKVIYRIRLIDILPWLLAIYLLRKTWRQFEK
jgi:hypothetical protein